MSIFHALTESIKWLIKVLTITAALAVCIGGTQAQANTFDGQVTAKTSAVSLKTSQRRTEAKTASACKNRETTFENGFKLIECVGHYSDPCQRDAQFPTALVHCGAHYLLARNIPNATKYQSCDTTMTYVQRTPPPARRLPVHFTCSSWGKMQG